MNGWPWDRFVRDESGGNRPVALLPRQNLLLVVSCFFFAVLLWMYVAGSESDADSASKTTRDIPGVAVQFSQGHMHVLETDTTAVSVTLQASEPLPERPLVYAVVDIRAISTPGYYTLPVHVQMLPDIDASALAVPDHVKVFLDNSDTRVLPIAFQATRHPQPGYVEGSAVLEPNRVTVSGPQSLLSSAHAEASFDLSNVTDDVDVMIPVQISDVPDTAMHLVKLTPSKIRLYLPVQKATAYATVPVSPRLVGEPPAGEEFVRAELTPPTITLSGHSDVVSGLQSVPTAPIDLSAVRHSYSTAARLVAPHGVQLESTPWVQVRITIRQRRVAPVVAGLPAKSAAASEAHPAAGIPAAPPATIPASADVRVPQADKRPH